MVYSPNTFLHCNRVAKEIMRFKIMRCLDALYSGHKWLALFYILSQMLQRIHCLNIGKYHEMVDWLAGQVDSKQITFTRLKLSMLILQIWFGEGQSLMGLNSTRMGLDSSY